MAPAIRAEALSKRYRVGEPHRPGGLVGEAISAAVAGWYRRLLRRRPASVGLPGQPPGRDTVWALRDVSFDIQPGEVVGIIGRNGAGKSTLLKILARITEPTTGQAAIHGRIASLLEVGTGFHWDLTGRENIYLNGAVLGMKRREINANFAQIVAFAEVERFIDTPVKHYSSGMYLRLAFAVAAHLNPEILIVDEVLAVGDAQFQKKCLGKMDQVAQSGRTVLFVSHNMAAVRLLCSRGLLLEQGGLTAVGPIAEVIQKYQEADQQPGENSRFNARHRSGSGWARVQDVRLVTEAGSLVGARPCDADLLFDIDLQVAHPEQGASLRGLVLEVVVCSDEGQALVSLMNIDDLAAELPMKSSCRLRMRLAGPSFVPGRYGLNLYLGKPGLELVDEVLDAVGFDISPPQRPWRPYELEKRHGILCRKAEWQCVDQAA